MARERIKGFWERVTPLIRIKYPTIKAFCEDADLNLQTFYNDRARLYYPPMDNIRRMAEKLDVSLDYLVFGDSKGTGFDEQTLSFIRKYNSATKPMKAVIDKILDDAVDSKDGD